MAPLQGGKLGPFSDWYGQSPRERAGPGRHPDFLDKVRSFLVPSSQGGIVGLLPCGYGTCWTLNFSSILPFHPPTTLLDCLPMPSDLPPPAYRCCSMMDAATTAMGSSQPAESLQQLLGVNLDPSLMALFGGGAAEPSPWGGAGSQGSASTSFSGHSRQSSHPSSSQAPSCNDVDHNDPYHERPAAAVKTGSPPFFAEDGPNAVLDHGYPATMNDQDHHREGRERVAAAVSPPAFDTRGSPVSAAELADALVAAAADGVARRKAVGSASAVAATVYHDLPGRAAPRTSNPPSGSSASPTSRAAPSTPRTPASATPLNNIVAAPSRVSSRAPPPAGDHEVHPGGGALSSASGDEEPPRASAASSVHTCTHPH